MCRPCSIEKGIGAIESYSTKPTPVFHGKGLLYFGFENEVSFDRVISPHTQVFPIIKHFKEDELLIKSDGSVNNGFEIVSHPHTFDKYCDKKWKLAFLDTMIKHSSCGMHIHLSRASFTTFHKYKFIHFIQSFPAFITKISGRAPNNYCGLSESPSTVLAKEGDSTRYRRINLSNSKTIELRCFAGAHVYEIWRKNIEFVQCLFNYTLITSAMDLNMRSFKLFVYNNKKEFPFLYEEMVRIYGNMPK